MKWFLLLAFLSCAHGAIALPDRDRDGSSDSIDLCPDEPEDIDGYEDFDGCSEADCDDCCSVITQRHIGFHRGESQIAAVARAVVDHIADELRSRADLRRVEVRGSAPDGDARLASARASAIRDALIAHSIAPARLVAVGAPGGKPRVTFRILDATCPPGG